MHRGRHGLGHRDGVREPAPVALNASFFNTERMLGQYVTKAYFE